MNSKPKKFKYVVAALTDLREGDVVALFSLDGRHDTRADYERMLASDPSPGSFNYETWRGPDAAYDEPGPHEPFCIRRVAVKS